jgi:hypothetical protein
MNDLISPKRFLSLLLVFTAIDHSDAQSPALGVNATPPIVVPSPQSSPAKSITPGHAQTAVLESERQALAKAGSKVVGEIQNQERDLYQRLQYFEKPTRLDPSSFATLQEVKDWQKLLLELKTKSKLVAKLYHDVPQNLDASIANEKINPQLGTAFKREIVNGFPWETIQKKDRLIQEFIDEHGKLLEFYEKNWGKSTTTQKSGVNQRVQFKSSQQTAIYNQLCAQIQATSKSLQAQYQLMSTH